MDLKLIKSKDIKELKDELKNIKNDNLELNFSGKHSVYNRRDNWRISL